jgi:hypothetical protein
MPLIYSACKKFNRRTKIKSRLVNALLYDPGPERHDDECNERMPKKQPGDVSTTKDAKDEGGREIRPAATTIVQDVPVDPTSEAQYDMGAGKRAIKGRQGYDHSCDKHS